MRDEWKCVLIELGGQFAMDTTATGASVMLLLCAASWDIKREASLRIATCMVCGHSLPINL